MSSPMTMVRLESMVVDWSVQRKSTDTSGSSLTTSTPFMGPLAASLNALFTSSANVFFSTCAGAGDGAIAGRGGVSGRSNSVQQCASCDGWLDAMLLEWCTYVCCREAWTRCNALHQSSAAAARTSNQQQKQH
eukprot:GHRQ01033147.1.p1 GENE.GHRQ01033147.1~~GHRQ01033147.1.p1  ORF type:complete len:133 (+),score=19.88 GHRQ01033147.1:766-1164(+)